jgi:hypothetical protein
MNCHTDEGNLFFSCNSYFVQVEQECPLEDVVPESVKLEKKKDNGITYLPGEKLLIQLTKQKKKKKKIIDIDRVTASLARIL